MKALFLVLHRFDRSPGQRYRHEQYIFHLEKNGIKCTFSPLLNQRDDEIFYSSGNYIKKVIIGLKALLRRLKDIQKIKAYDVVYIYRDAFFFGTFIERMLVRQKIRLIYDFDDSIWLMDKNSNQGIFNLLKNPNKVPTIISLCDQIIVGNKYLKAFAIQFNPNIKIIPSTINFSEYKSNLEADHEKICVGWTGSFSTIKHFEKVVPSLIKIKERFHTKVYFKLIGDPSYESKFLDIKGIKWNSETEAQDLNELDIGLMPLPDDEWSRGKCAMKGLQYMALGIPTIMSPVGVNKDIIDDGVNGYLASTDEEWIEKISLLIEDESLRKKMGKAGKETVEKDFSLEANKEKWLNVFLNN